MRIGFVLSDISAPPKQGLHEQSLMLVRELLDRGHSVDVFGFVRGNEFSKPNFLRVAPVECLELSRTRSPWLLRALMRTAWRIRPGVRHQLEKIASGGYDALHFEGVGALAILPSALHAISTPVVVNLIDPGSLRFSRRAREARGWWRKLIFTLAGTAHAWVESRIARSGIPVVLVSQTDLRYFQHAHPSANAHFIPLLVPATVPKREHSRGDARSETKRVVISCDLRQSHMKEAVDRLLRSPLASLGDTEVVLLGRISADNVDAARYGALGVKVVEWVPDYLDYLRTSSLVILPDVFGTGIKNRALQAMSLGVPVLATDVAMEGIPASAGTDYIPLDLQTDWVQTMVKVLSSPEQLADIGLRGRNLVDHLFSTDRTVDSWLALYHGSTGRVASEGATENLEDTHHHSQRSAFHG